MGILWARTDKKIAEYQKELINTHYQEVENMYKKMRMWRHDYRNHIQLLKALADKGDYGRLREYLDELDTDLRTVDTVIKTGNPMADAILNSKISLANSKDISVQADAHIPVRLSTSELDLCCIIRIYMDMKGSQLYISFTNFTAQKKRKKESGRFATTKGEGRGLGLMRVDAIVERLGGYLSRNSEDGAFTTEILLPQSAE